MKQISLFISFLLISLFAQGQSEDIYKANSIPEKLLKNADEVIRLETSKLEIISKRMGSFSFRKVVTILNKDSYENNIVIYYDKSTRVRKVSASIYDENGEFIRKMHKRELSDYSAVSDFSIYEDNRVKHVKLQHNKYPFTIEYEYSMEVTGLELLSKMSWNPQSFDQSIEKASYTLDAPDNFHFNIKQLNFEQEPRKVTNSRKKYSWKVTNLAAIPYQPNAPSRSTLFPSILISPSQFIWDGYEFSLDTWDDYGILMNRLYEGRDILTPEVKSEIRALTANATSDTEKVHIVYDYLQKNTRYVSVQLGIGGWQPFDAEYVSTNKYGDCKALTNFTKALLKEVDILSYPALIYAGKLNYEVTEDFTSPAFNHVILYVPDEDIWLECTSNDFPPNYLGTGSEDRNVFLIQEQGGAIVRTPKTPIEDNYVSRNVSIQLDIEGTAKIECKEQTSGNRHQRTRSQKFYGSEEEIRKDFQKEMTLPSFTIEKLELNYQKDAPIANRNYTLTVPRYGSKAGKRIFVPLNSLSAYNRIPSDTEERIHPIVSKVNYIELDEFIIQLPEGYEVESIPKEPVNIECAYGTYKMEVTLDGSKIKYSRYFKKPSIEIPASEYDVYRQFFKDVSKADKTKMVLVQKRT